MTKVYVMESCPDCVEVKQRYSNDEGYQLIDIGRQARDLKEFIALRDTHPAFAKVRERGTIGIPCFVMEDGRVIISVKRYDEAMGNAVPGESVSGTDAGGAGGSGLNGEKASGAFCSLDGSGC